jgi:hypothetical protein
MASLAELLDYDQRKKQMLSALQAGTDVINRGTIAGTLGTPVDLANTALQAVGLGSEKPVLGSEWIGDKMQQAGMVSPERRPVAEFAAGFVNPETAATKGVMLAKALASKTAPLHAMMVFHGTPHTLPPTKNNPLGEFDASKIGTGEGAAAYGHGIYTAQNPEVAKEYQKRLSDETFTTGKGEAFAPAELEHLNVRTVMRFGDLDAAIAKAKEIAAKGQSRLPDRLQGSAKQMAKNDLKRLQEIKKTGGLSAHKGNLYTVDLPDEHIERMLNWDKPLSEQHPDVQKAFHTIAKNDPDLPLDFLIKGNAVGGSLIQAMDKVKASTLLRNQGIPGIKYLDEGSRNKAYEIKLSVKGKPYETDPITFATKEQANKAAKEYASKGFTADVKDAGTRNFVVFPGEEQNLKILKRE